MAQKNPLSLLAKLRRYDGNSVEEFLRTEMRQNFKAIEDAFRKAPAFEVIDVSIGSGSETEIPHKLGAVPDGFLVINRDDFSNVMEGSSAWTNENIYLLADTTANFRIVVIRF